MKATWLQKSGEEKVVIFYNGWGMDAGALMPIRFDGFDVLMLNQYRGFDTKLPVEQLEPYATKILVAWSLGVAFANLHLNGINFSFDKSIAINGTAFPSHETYGIPPAIFNQTLEGWNERNRNKFNLRMYGGKSRSQQLEKTISSIPEIEQKKELQFFKDNLDAFGKTTFQWDVAIVGKQDFIVPYEAQKYYWKKEENTIVAEAEIPHYGFDLWETWDRLIQYR